MEAASAEDGERARLEKLEKLESQLEQLTSLLLTERRDKHYETLVQLVSKIDPLFDDLKGQHCASGKETFFSLVYGYVKRMIQSSLVGMDIYQMEVEDMQQETRDLKECFSFFAQEPGRGWPSSLKANYKLAL